MARHIVRNEEDAQDAVQEALLNAFRNLSTFDERSTFFTWATRIAINSSLIQLRKRRQVFLKFTDYAPEDLAVKDPSPDPEALLAEKDEQKLLHEAIRSLPRKLRVVVELKQFQERSIEEMASALSITCPAAIGPQTLSVPVLNGIRHMDLLMERFGKHAVLGGVCVVATEMDPQGRIVQRKSVSAPPFHQLKSLQLLQVLQEIAKNWSSN